MPLQIFNDQHFVAENAQETNCVRVIWDVDDFTSTYDNLIVYRFGNRATAWDWTSPKRQAQGGNFARPSDTKLNQLALSQVRFGRKGVAANDTPFVSVATNYEALYNHGEAWVQKLLKVVPDLGVFVVPFATVMRPGINSHATKVETEWLYYDGDNPLLDYLDEWRTNPYRQ